MDPSHRHSSRRNTQVRTHKAAATDLSIGGNEEVVEDQADRKFEL